VVGDADMKTSRGTDVRRHHHHAAVVYRSVTPVFDHDVHGGDRLLSARGIVAFLGITTVFGLTTVLDQHGGDAAIRRRTDYAIFLIGRYQEARSQGGPRIGATYTMFSSTAHVVVPLV